MSRAPRGNLAYQGAVTAGRRSSFSFVADLRPALTLSGEGPILSISAKRHRSLRREVALENSSTLRGTGGRQAPPHSYAWIMTRVRRRRQRVGPASERRPERFKTRIAG